MKKMKKIFIYTHSCNLRSLDASRMRSYFSQNNYQIVNNPKEADTIFYISCAAYDYVADKSLQKVKEFKKFDAELIVAGCLPEIEKKSVAEIFDGVTIGTKDLDKNPEKIDKLFPENKIKFKDIDDTNISFENLDGGKLIGVIKTILNKIQWAEKIVIKIRDHVFKNLLNENSFFYGLVMDKPYRIRISWGCPNSCSYCGIKKAIGPHKSKPLEQCIEEFKNGLKKDYKHFLINADDVGAYGIDTGHSFPELLDKMTKIPGEYESTIANLNPRWVVKYIDKLEDIFERQKITRLCIPIQSGCSRILKIMNRYSDVEKIKDAFQRLRTTFPDVQVSTHIMVGFPSETEEEFKESLSLIQECNISAGQVIPFSCKRGTKAELIEEKISEYEIVQRLKYGRLFLKNAGYNVISQGYATVSLPSMSKVKAFLFEKMD